MPMDWDRLRIFHVVAEAGSFTHAGERLNLSQSAISRQISSLEESVRVPLFHRHARGLLLTEQGEVLYRTAKDVFHKLSMAEARLAETKDRPSGPLKVTTTMAFGSTWLTSQIREFIDLFPDVEVTLLLSDEELDLGMRQADVSIRMSPPRQPDLIQRPLMSVKQLIYGSEDYFQRHGKPQAPPDLDHHDLIVFGEATPLPSKSVNWLLEAGARPEAPRRPILRVNNVYGIYRAVRSGLGLAALPKYMQPEQGRLEPVLTELEGPTIRAYFVYPQELRHSKRITVFRDFLLRKVAEHNF